MFKWVTNKKKTILENSPQDDEFKKDTFGKFVASLILKDYLIYENEVDVYCKYIGYVSQNNNLKQKQISQIVKEFMTDDLFNKRNLLINLLTRSSDYDNQYLAYLLYDLLSNDINGNVDTQ